MACTKSLAKTSEAGRKELETLMPGAGEGTGIENNYLVVTIRVHFLGA